MTQELTEPAPFAASPQKSGNAPARPGAFWRQPYLYLVLLLGIVVFNGVYALPRYLHFDSARSRTQLNPAHSTHFGFVVVHVITGNIALITVLLQLWPWLRRNYPQVHRITGRIYILAGALPVGITALIALIPFRDGGFGGPGSVGFTANGVLLLVTTVVGWRMARKRMWAEHQRWMVYSFALALGTSWGRMLFESITTWPSLGKHISIFALIEISSWLGWVVSLLVAHWWIESRGMRSTVKDGGETVMYASPAR